MIIGVTINKLCVCHLGEIYYSDEAMKIVREYGTKEDISYAEWLEAKCIIYEQ